MPKNDISNKSIVFSDDMRQHIKSLSIGTTSGTLARFFGWPIEKTWYRMQEKQMPFRNALRESLSRRSCSVLISSYKQAGLFQSILQPIAYMGIINLTLREEDGGFKKPTVPLVIKVGFCSALCESLVTTNQERKKASLFSGKKFLRYNFFSPQVIRSFGITAIKNFSVNSFTLAVTLEIQQLTQKHAHTQSGLFEILTYMVSAYIAAAPTQLIGMPFVNIQNRVFRDPNKSIYYHAKRAFNSGLIDLYKGASIRFIHQGFLGSVSFGLTVTLNRFFSAIKEEKSNDQIHP